MVEYLKLNSPEHSARNEADLEFDIYQDAVALLLRNDIILIRSDPEFMSHVFAADAMLQQFIPKDRIQFTGLHIPEVRRNLRHKGESWRMSPAPRSAGEMAEYVRASRVWVHTGLTVYYNAPTGGRFLTYSEFMRIRPLMDLDPKEALSRLKEILLLFQRVNNWGCRELSFFLPAGRSLDCASLEEAVCAWDSPAQPGPNEEVKRCFDRFADLFALTAGTELMADDENNAVWRTTMFCRISDINEEEMEEWALGLSSEFHLNVKWLPGATVSDGSLQFDPSLSKRTQGLITSLWERTAGFLSINIGHVELPQTHRDISGQERDVYLVVMTTKEGKDAIRLLRLMKWDVIHRIKIGVPVQQAIAETLYYRDYIFDRLHAAAQLGFPILSYNDIRLDEEIPGLGVLPAFFFERPYVQGTVTDKIPLSCYGKPAFLTNLSRLLGAAATFSLVLGKASPVTGKMFYDDGDELVQFDQHGIPNRLVIIETTGSFTDWTTPLLTLLPQCLTHLRGHLEKGLKKGLPMATVQESISIFADSLVEKIREVKAITESPSSGVAGLFRDRKPEPGGIRNRWEGILSRLRATDCEELREYILTSPELRFDRF
jgi:hypothetical protein